MGTEKINRLKIVLVEQGKTGKWLAEQLGNNEATISRWCSNATPTFIGNADEDSGNSGSECKGFD